MEINILLYYKFVNIENTEEFVMKHLEFCKRLGVLGKVLIAKEGINGSISGTKEQTEMYKKELYADKRFSDIVFKEEIGLMYPFKKISVRLRKEIIRMDQDIDIEKKGKYISPKELIDLYKNNEDFVILDTRNDYESDVGKFKNALTPKIQTFREFPKVVEKLKDKKDKKIVMYCTGGIRCEKASAYLVEQGFNDISQLHGGIITFCQEYPNSSIWQGKCFVFDNRIISNVDDENAPLTKCEFCNINCDLYRNCKNPNCNHFMAVCDNCQLEHKGCCCKECFEKYNEFLSIKMEKNRGRKSKIEKINA